MQYRAITLFGAHMSIYVRGGIASEQRRSAEDRRRECCRVDKYMRQRSNENAYDTSSCVDIFFSFFFFLRRYVKREASSEMAITQYSIKANRIEPRANRFLFGSVLAIRANSIFFLPPPPPLSLSPPIVRLVSSLITLFSRCWISWYDVNLPHSVNDARHRHQRLDE